MKITKHDFDDSVFETALKTAKAAKNPLVVCVIVRADSNNRFVRADGLIDGQTVATASAQDATAPGVPSVNTNSFTLIVPPGRSARVSLINGSPANIVVQSYTW